MAITCHQNPRNVIFSEKKAPAAVHHTHTGHKKHQERHFFINKQHIYVYIYIYIHIYTYISLFWEKKMGYILYSKHINASHICPPKRNQLFKQRKWELSVFGKTLTFTCKLHIKVMCFIKFWNDPTVIPVILPQPVWLETPSKVQFLAKVLGSIFQQKFNF